MFYSILFLFILDVYNDQITAQQTCVHSSDPLVRCTTQGLIRGVRFDFSVNSSNLTSITTERQSVYAFLGVPYGEPPVGHERFRKPISKRPWTRGKIYDTTTLPNSCYQMIINYFNASGEKIWAPFTPLSEDCLYLNIWTPTTARQQPLLAVMIWIYGGGFTSGTVEEIDF
jgi:carboxylesterase type B